MQVQARLSAITGNAATSADVPNKIMLKFEPLYLADEDAAWLFEHLGQFLTISLERQPVTTPMDEALSATNGRF